MQYDDICLPPIRKSSLDSRSEADTSVEFCGIKLDVPMIASPMPDICNGLMAGMLAKNGAMGIIHRFQKIEEQRAEFVRAWDLAGGGVIGEGKITPRPIGCAIGVKGDFLERMEELYSVGCLIFCLDTANGFNSNVLKAIKNIRARFPNEMLKPQNSQIRIIAGNVATKEGFRYLKDYVDAIRVGIAGGSVCETKTETGVYYPMPLSILECACVNEKPQTSLIADGGIKKPEDMIKAIALGADVVMCGRIFAGYRETPGEVIKINGFKNKLYRGSASYSVQREVTGEKPDHNEGDETLVPYIDESVAKVIQRFKSGLQSSMSYHDSRTLDVFRKSVNIRVGFWGAQYDQWRNGLRNYL